MALLDQFFVDVDVFIDDEGSDVTPEFVVRAGYKADIESRNDDERAMLLGERRNDFRVAGRCNSGGEGKKRGLTGIRASTITGCDS